MSFEPLPQPQEDELHSVRLLNVEERHYKRIFKTLLARTNPINEYISRKPTSNPTDTTSFPLPDNEEEPTVNGSISTNTSLSPSLQAQKQDEYTRTLATFHHTIHHDHTSLLSNLARSQFLLRQNHAEVARYKTQTTTITQQCHTVKRETATLRLRLQRARATMETRRNWDVLAEGVLYNRDHGGREHRRTRAELGGAMDKLRAEIEELEREGEDLKSAWLMRREVFGDMVREGQRLRRVVRNEAEKTEMDEPENEIEDGNDNTDAESDAGTATERDGEDKRREEDEPINTTGHQMNRPTSQIGTPRPGTPRMDHDSDMAIDGMAGDVASGSGSGTAVPEVTVTDEEVGGVGKDVDMT